MTLSGTANIGTSQATSTFSNATYTIDSSTYTINTPSYYRYIKPNTWEWDAYRGESTIKVAPDVLESVEPHEDGSAVVKLRYGTNILRLFLTPTVIRQLLEALGDGFSCDGIRSELENLFENESDRKEGHGE